MDNLKKIANLIIFLLVFSVTNAQQLFFPVNNEINFRIEKKVFADSNFHSSIKPFQYSDVYNSNYEDSSFVVKIKNTFFKKLFNNNIIKIKKSNFEIKLNPILESSYKYSITNKKSAYNFKAGVYILGDYKKISYNLETFYALEQKTFYNKIPNDSIKIIPNFSTIYNETDNLFSYFLLNGYLSYTPLKYVNFQFGKGKNFWGEGYRSLFLSDNSNSYPFIKTSINIWKFRYIWLIGSLKDYNSDKNDFSLKQKYMFSHYLSWNTTKWLNVNLFESIISNPVDSTGVNYLNINYLNPVVFFRPVEFSSGTSDNALFGLGFKIKILKKYQIYSQIVLDEFVFAEIKSSNNWWGNKYGIQVGLKTYNFLNIKNLLLLLEYNYIRPYTYSYSNTIQNYGNYYQALAHPSGANIQEIVFLSNYNYKRFSIQLKTIYSNSGIDTDTISYGADIYKSYIKRKDDYGNYMLQGLKTEYIYIELSNKWIINPKYNISLFLNVSKTIYKNRIENKNILAISFGVKSQLFNKNNDYF